MQPSLAAFVTAGLDATWATLLLWSKEKKVTVAHNDEIDLLSAASHMRGAAPKGAAVTATASMAAGAPQGQQTANWSSHVQPSTPQWPWIPAAAHAADGGRRAAAESRSMQAVQHYYQHGAKNEWKLDKLMQKEFASAQLEEVRRECLLP